ncbi:MAG: hypothetical protein AAF696_35830 [Bacteroidota bacterium]
MKIKWCWRCKDWVPMLDKEEFMLCQRALREGKPLVEAEIKKRGIDSFPWLKYKDLTPARRARRYFLEMYRVITGHTELNPNVIYHHVLDQHGPDCPVCKKALRTARARYCAACGFGKEDFLSPDTLPLIERRPDLFPEEEK